MILSQTTSTEKTGKQLSRQLLVDVSEFGDGTAEKVANTNWPIEIQQSMNGVERIAVVAPKDFHKWRMNGGVSLTKFSVNQDREVVFRLTTDEGLEPHITRQRLVEPK